MEPISLMLFAFMASLQVELASARMRLRLWLDDFKSSRRGAISGGVVGALVGIMVSLLIAIVVVMELISSQTQAGWSADANSTWTSLTGNIWTALTLLVIVPIIVGAVVILSYVRRGM